MLPEIKTAWLEALRSGEYKQTRGKLKGILFNPDRGDYTDHGYCCLGVLACVVQKKLPSLIKLREEGDDLLVDAGSGNVTSGSLPVPLLHSLDLVEVNQRNLINYNDREGWSFNQIADWIETNL